MDKIKIVFATANPHKIEELRAIAKANGIKNVEFVLPPEGFNPEETGLTFEENSLIKAKEANRLTGMMALADDSGLCVEALNGEPGIHSARFAETAQARIDKLLKLLENEENRKAKFVCAMTLVNEKGDVIYTTRGECTGEIAYEPSGKNGFGYDPVFIVGSISKQSGDRFSSNKVRNKGLTMSEMSENEKNKISHRARALNNILDFVKKF